MKSIPERIESTAPDARAEGLRAAGLLTGEEAAAIHGLAGLIVARLRDPEAAVRKAALEAASQLVHRAALDFEPSLRAEVERLTEDDDEMVRAEAAVGLALVSGDAARSTELLERLLGDPSPRVRREAAAALGDHGDRRAIGRLEEHLDDGDEETRFEAAFALASLKDGRGISILCLALTTATRRLDACEGLRRLGSRDAIPALERTSKSFLLGWPERLSVWTTLYALGERDVAASIIERTKAWNREERALALGLIGIHKVVEGAAVLAEVAQDRRDPLQATAVRALGDLGQSSAVRLLEALASDTAQSLELRIDAVDALLRLPDAQSARDRLKASATPEIASAARREG